MYSLFFIKISVSNWLNLFFKFPNIFTCALSFIGGLFVLNGEVIIQELYNLGWIPFNNSSLFSKVSVESFFTQSNSSFTFSLSISLLCNIYLFTFFKSIIPFLINSISFFL